jgi:hypothetical protein
MWWHCMRRARHAGRRLTRLRSGVRVVNNRRNERAVAALVIFKIFRS